MLEEPEVKRMGGLSVTHRELSINNTPNLLNCVRFENLLSLSVLREGCTTDSDKGSSRILVPEPLSSQDSIQRP